MKPVSRHEILPLEAYERVRDEFRRQVLQIKAARRVHLGENLTLLFENPMTVRYQIQEMLRIERITAEAAVLHEIATYNELLGDDGGLGCTLLIEIDDPGERARKLAEWRGLPGALYLQVEGGARVPARFDPRQVGELRLSSVQYLKFDVGGRLPVAAGVEMPGLVLETRLAEEQRQALRTDLS